MSSLRKTFFVVFLTLLVLSLPNHPILFSAQNLTCTDLLQSGWNLTGDNGDAQASQTIAPSVLQQSDRLIVTYDLNGLEARDGDASALIFEIPYGSPWNYISLSSYGSNGLDGEQTVEVPLSAFAPLDLSHSEGAIRARFWYESAFSVDISRIQACGAATVPTNPPPTSTDLPTVIPSTTPTPTIPPTQTLVPSVTVIPTDVPTATNSPSDAMPMVEPGEVVLLNSTWTLTGQNSSAEQSVSFDPFTLSGMDTVKVVFDLNGLVARTGRDDGVLVIEQNGWNVIKLGEKGQNGFDGIQTIEVPLSEFVNIDNNPNLDVSQPANVLKARFWHENPFIVEIHRVSVLNRGSSTVATDVPTDTPMPTATAIPTATIVPSQSNGIELLNQDWTGLTASQGAVERYQNVDPTIFIGKDHLRVTLDLNGATLLGGDASALIINQSGWRFVSLSNYVQQGLDGPQTLTIPIADFGFDPYSNLGPMQIRLWSDTTITVDVTSIVAVGTVTPTQVPTTTSVPNVVGNGDGLYGIYYDNMDFTGLSTDRIDAQLDFNWGEGSPDPQIDAETFSVRWSGFIEAPSTETWMLCVTSDDGNRLYVNGQLLFEDWEDQAPSETCAPIQFNAGQMYSVTLEYYEHGIGAMLRLEWYSDTRPREVIPQSQLYAAIFSLPTPTVSPTPVVTLSPTSEPIPQTPVSTPIPTIQACPSGTGPNGITAGDYPAHKLTQDERQWLFSVFGNTGSAPVGYGGEVCGTRIQDPETNLHHFICSQNGVGPGNLPIGGYPAGRLTPEQRTWLYTSFRNTGDTPVGYGGQFCPGSHSSSTQNFFAYVCSQNLVGPNGIRPGSYDGNDITQDQRQWLWVIFREDQNPSSVAPVGYNGQHCPGQNGNYDASYIRRARVCASGAIGPFGITPQRYPDGSLTPEEQEWLYRIFENTGDTPVGYHGETCPGQVDDAPPPDRSVSYNPTLPQCPVGVGEPGSFAPTSLTPQQREELWIAFGHANEGDVPEGYGGEQCIGGVMTLPSFVGSPDPDPPPTTIQTFYGWTTGPLSPGQYISVNVNGLSVRGAPGTESPQIGRLVENQSYRIVTRNAQGDWGQLQDNTNSAIGWVYIADPAWVTVFDQGDVNDDSGHFRTISIIHRGTQYDLLVNTHTCAIVNGSEIVLMEIETFESWINQVPIVDRLDETLNYLELEGYIDQFRMDVEARVTSITGCHSTYYLVGNLYMDTNGLGNVMYGYITSPLPWLVVAEVANIKQKQRDGDLTVDDWPDDVIQTEMGRMLKWWQEGGTTLTPEVVETIAEVARLQ